MKKMNLSVNVKAEKLLVTQFFYDLLVDGENESIKIEGDSVKYQGIPVEVDNTVKHMEFIFDTSIDASTGDLYSPEIDEKQVVYKLRHKPTGLYLEPRGCTVNASVLGKVYTRKPPRQNFWGIPYELRGCFEEDYRLTPLDEWEIVEFELKEIKKEEV